MKKHKLLILDDDPNFSRRYVVKLNEIPGFTKNFDPTEIQPTEFAELIVMLENRRTQARGADLGAFRDKCPLDDVDILIVDYDLLALKGAGVMTGENVAYLARSFSRCGFILGLNQYGVDPFDLTLKGHPDSFADLNIGSEQLDNPGLWVEPWKGFRPWAWPLIPQAIEAYQSRVRELHGCMGERILSWLKIPDLAIKLLPRTVTEFITKSPDPNQTTFAEFVAQSGNGLRSYRDQTSKECETRIAAARVSKWLERLVLSGQDILVDAPHLVSRFPSLLKGKARTATAFNRAASLQPPDKLGIDHAKIRDYRFIKSDWLSRPAWYWPSISALDSIEEVKQPWDVKRTDLAFCEDTSRFVPKKECQEFVADLPSQYARRYVEKVDYVDYRPGVRLSL
jgi:hypothetical protein